MIGSLWKVGIIGCGRIAGGLDTPSSEGQVISHAQAIHRHPAFEITTAVDSDSSALKRFKDTWDVRNIFSDIQQLSIGPALDVVYICSPDELHFTQATHFLTMGHRPKFLMIEKPVCLASDEIIQLKDLAENSGVGVAVNHTRRFDPSHINVAQVIRSGELGSFMTGHSTYYGGWLHNGGHLIDTLIMLFGRSPEVESSVVSGSHRPGDEDLDVRLTIGGRPIDIDAVDESDYQLFEIELRFQNGRVRLLDFGGTVIVEKVVTNSLNERVLTPSASYPTTGLTDTPYRVAEAINTYLRGKPTVIEGLGVSLVYATITMKVLWEARNLAFGKEKSVLGSAN